MPWTSRLLVGTLAVVTVVGSSVAAELGVQGSRFTIDDQPTFLLGISYYGARCDEEIIVQDLDEIQKHGFNWLRVWATWSVLTMTFQRWAARGTPAHVAWKS